MRKGDVFRGWSWRDPKGRLAPVVYNRNGAEFYMCLAFKNRDEHVTNCVRSPEDHIAAKAAGYRLAQVRVTAL